MRLVFYHSIVGAGTRVKRTSNRIVESRNTWRFDTSPLHLELKSHGMTPKMKLNQKTIAVNTAIHARCIKLGTELQKPFTGFFDGTTWNIYLRVESIRHIVSPSIHNEV